MVITALVHQGLMARSARTILMTVHLMGAIMGHVLMALTVILVIVMQASLGSHVSRTLMNAGVSMHFIRALAHTLSPAWTFTF